MENLLDRKACSPTNFSIDTYSVFSVTQTTKEDTTTVYSHNKITSLRDLKGLHVSVSVIPKFGMSYNRSHVTLSCRGPTTTSTKKK